MAACCFIYTLIHALLRDAFEGAYAAIFSAQVCFTLRFYQRHYMACVAQHIRSAAHTRHAPMQRTARFFARVTRCFARVLRLSHYATITAAADD